MSPDQKLSAGIQKEEQDKIQHLVAMAFEKGILEAIAAARTYEDPYLLDAFHDLLVDKLYDELIARRQINELK